MKPQSLASDESTAVPAPAKPRRPARVLPFPSPTEEQQSNADARHMRRVVAILRHPEATLVAVLSRMWKMPAPHSVAAIHKAVATNPQALDLLLAARQVSSAYRTFILISMWREYVREHADAGITVSTKRFLSILRRRGVRVSKSWLYRGWQALEASGLVALVPRYGCGGRPRRRTPPEHQALIERLLSGAASYRCYVASAKVAGLSEPPISECTWRRLRAEWRRNQDSVSTPWGSK